MPRREQEPIVRKHVHLFSSDVERLEELYGQTLSVNKAIRMIVRAAVKKIDEKIAEKKERPNINPETLDEELTLIGSETREHS